MGAHGRAVGVDFGTSTALVAERMGRRPVDIAPLGNTTKWFPSLAGYDGDRIVVGEDADHLPVDQVVRSIKRAITERRNHVQVTGRDGPRDLAADDVIVAILSEIDKRAASLGLALATENDLRLGCPAMWDGEQRQRLLHLATEAGIPPDTLTLVEEPIAAGVAWVAHRFVEFNEQPKGRLLVFDMGGGTLDVAVLDVVGGERPEISVLSALGVPLAGDHLDAQIAKDLEAELAERGHDLSTLPRQEQVGALMLRAARNAKERLTSVRTHPIVLPSQIGQSLPTIRYSREQLDEALRPQIDSAKMLIESALRSARLTEHGNYSAAQLGKLKLADLAGDVKFVLLAGGMSRIPSVERTMRALFQEAEVFDNAGVPPDEAIVAGLADTAGYDRVNLHRPGFDFVVEWQAGGRSDHATLYEAYTPLYEPWKVAAGYGYLGYEVLPKEFPGPKSGSGVLRVRTPSGEHVRLMVDGKELLGLPFTFGNNMHFKLFCDGRIFLHDGAGAEVDLRVDRWPIIHGHDYAAVVLTNATAEGPALTNQWYLNKDWAPPGSY